MTVPIQNLRSSVSSKRPTATGLSVGQIAVNYHEDDPAIYLRGQDDSLIKIAPAFIGSGAPNAAPASGGSSGNSIGEFWFDTTTTPPQLKIYNGSEWQEAGGAGATGSGGDQVFLETDQTVTTSYTLSANKNAVVPGPLTIASGVTVTVPSGSNLVIV